MSDIKRNATVVIGGTILFGEIKIDAAKGSAKDGTLEVVITGRLSMGGNQGSINKSVWIDFNVPGGFNK